MGKRQTEEWDEEKRCFWTGSSVNLTSVEDSTESAEREIRDNAVDWSHLYGPEKCAACGANPFEFGCVDFESKKEKRRREKERKRREKDGEMRIVTGWLKNGRQGMSRR